MTASARVCTPSLVRRHRSSRDLTRTRSRERLAPITLVLAAHLPASRFVAKGSPRVGDRGDRDVAEALVRFGPVAMTDAIVGGDEREHARGLRAAP